MLFGGRDLLGVAVDASSGFCDGHGFDGDDFGVEFADDGEAGLVLFGISAGGNVGDFSAAAEVVVHVDNVVHEGEEEHELRLVVRNILSWGNEGGLLNF
ncbi:MAG: hypothetical protein ACI8UZ_001681 [Akkermansiaceae bacterium]|jgi:hypothetical protein